MSTHESGSAQVLAAPEAAWIAMPASVHLRRPTSDDIAGTTGGSLSRPRASVTCAGRTTTRRAALLRASAGCMHWAGWARKSHLKTRFLARTAPRGARWLDDILGAQCEPAPCSAVVCAVWRLPTSLHHAFVVRDSGASPQPFLQLRRRVWKVGHHWRGFECEVSSCLRLLG